MGRSTGIELGPDSCVMVAARQGRGAIDVSAVQAVDPANWPSHDVAITAALKAARRSLGLPRRAAVVFWGLPDDAASAEPTTRAAVRPITAAGFKVDAILTPPHALAALAATRPRQDPDAAVAWMALNTYGVALAIVRNGELLFSRTFDWAYRPDVGSSRGQLLQRYSLVSHLAPEVQRGIAAVRAAYGVTVETAVTCGDLPELRSLTMPLIEELDLEVETLDSTEGLRPTRRAKGDRFAESAPGIRLAVAAAVLPVRRRRAIGAPLRKAAAVLLFAGLGWLAYAAYMARPADPASTPQTAQAPPSPPPLPPQSIEARATVEPPAAGIQDRDRDPAAAVPTLEPHAPPVTSPVEPPVTMPVPPPVTPPVAPLEPASRPARPAAGAPAPAVPTTAPAESSQVIDLKPVVALPAADRPAARAQAPPAGRRPPPLEAPLPRIDSILIDHSRRLAIVNGEIVRVGDPVGPRVVVQIDAEAVILREPSGLNVRVTLRDVRDSTGL